MSGIGEELLGRQESSVAQQLEGGRLSLSAAVDGGGGEGAARGWRARAARWATAVKPYFLGEEEEEDADRVPMNGGFNPVAKWVGEG